MRGMGKNRSKSPAPTCSHQVEMYASSVYRQTDGLHQTPVQHHLGWSVVPRGSCVPAVPVQEVLCAVCCGGQLVGEASLVSSAWRRLELL